MGSARDTVRVHFSKTGQIGLASVQFSNDVAKGNFDGKYYRVVPGIKRIDDDTLSIKAVSQTGTLEVGVITFHIKSGNSEIKWHDEDPDK